MLIIYNYAISWNVLVVDSSASCFVLWNPFPPKNPTKQTEVPKRSPTPRFTRGGCGLRSSKSAKERNRISSASTSGEEFLSTESYPWCGAEIGDRRRCQTRCHLEGLYALSHGRTVYYRKSCTYSESRHYCTFGPSLREQGSFRTSVQNRKRAFH